MTPCSTGASSGDGRPGPASFAATADHELRAPLSSIHVALQLALAGSRELLRAEDREMLEISIKSTERLVRWVNGFIDRPVREADAASLAFGPVAAVPLAEEAVRAMRPLALARRVTVAADFDAALPLVDADRNGIVRVLANLLSQAIERSPAGGLVQVTVRRVPAGVEFSVTDQGTGRTSDGGSRGGLAVCQAIVEQHGGRLSQAGVSPAGCRHAFTVASAHAALPDPGATVTGIAS